MFEANSESGAPRGGGDNVPVWMWVFINKLLEIVSKDGRREISITGVSMDGAETETASCSIPQNELGRHGVDFFVSGAGHEEQ